MSWPSSNTRPVIQPPSTNSCMRLSVRRKVDFPQPDGPIRACTWFDANDSVALFTAVVLPYIAVSLSVSIRALSSATGQLTPRDSEPGTDAEHQHDEDQHQGRGPGITVPFLVGAGGIGEHRQRQCRHRLVEPEAEILAPERGEQQRGGLARDARHREQ